MAFDPFAPPADEPFDPFGSHAWPAPPTPEKPTSRDTLGDTTDAEEMLSPMAPMAAPEHRKRPTLGPFEAEQFSISDAIDDAAQRGSMQIPEDAPRSQADGGQLAEELYDEDFQVGLQESSGRCAAGEEYEIVFEREKKLGMLLEREDRPEEPGSQRQTQVTVAKIVLANGPADVRGVIPMSELVAINGRSLAGVSYRKVLDALQAAPRPLTIRFQRGQDTDSASHGLCYVKTGNKFAAPRSFERWKPYYFVLGGAIAPANVLQLYMSREAFEDTVVRTCRREPAQAHVRAFRLTRAHKISSITKRRYEHHSVKFFSIQPPSARLTVMRIGSEDTAKISELHSLLTQFCAVG